MTTSLSPRPARNTTADAVDTGLRSYMLLVYNYMTMGILMTGIVSWLSATTGFAELLYGPHSNKAPAFCLMIAPIAYVFFMAETLRGGSVRKGQIVFLAFTALLGLNLSAIFLQYTGESITKTFFATAVSFAGLSLYGYTTNRDLSGFRSFLIMGLVGLIVVGFLNLVIQSTLIESVAAIAGILVFAGLTAYDTQSIKNRYHEATDTSDLHRIAIWGAVNLYLDFINLLLYLLHFMGAKKD